MSYSDILQPRRDVLSEDGIEGIIDLANLDRKRKLESRPADFFDLTYPSADARRVIETLHRRFIGDSDAPGLYLFEGLKGSGKSHLLLMVYHLFASTDAAKAWLSRYGLQCNLPRDAVVVINKFTDLPLYSIWDFVFKRLTGRAPQQTGLPPSLSEVQSALGDRSLVLILDELEQGIRIISNEAARAQNIAFLQMISEWGNRENRVTILASIYSDREEPGSTLKRVPSCRVRFEHSADKARVVLHRLFENSPDMTPDQIRPTVESYLAAWLRHGAIRTEDFASRLSESFPFSPDLLQIILDRVPARGGFQNVRGALGFLARMVKLTHQRTDLITPAHADLKDQEVAARLADLDPSGDLIRRACGNLQELTSYPLVAGLGAAAMLYTLTGSGRDRGATREELSRAALTPTTDINEFEQALLVLQRYGSYFHAQEGRYYFDREENADAKVEFRSLTIDPLGTKAAELIKRLWREELFRDPAPSVVFTDIDQTKVELDAMEKGRLRFVLSPRRLTIEERHLLYFGIAERNQIILLEPKDVRFNGLSSRDLTKWAQRALAADELSTTPDSQRKGQYERLAREDKKNIMDSLRKAGLVYIRIEKYGDSPGQDVFEEEGLGLAVSREDVVTKLAQEVYPTPQVAEHLREQLSKVFGRTVKDVDRDYRTLLGYPVPTHSNSVTKAIRSLCRDGALGVRHSRGDFCREDPTLSEPELFQATIDPPFEKSRVSPILTPVLRPSASPEIQTTEPSPSTTRIPVRENIREIAVPAQQTPAALRQELATRLQELSECRIANVRFFVYFETKTGDLSSLPQGLRGNLTGPGYITAEINLSKENAGGKGEVERLAECLPSLPGASYSARLDVLAPEDREDSSA